MCRQKIAIIAFKPGILGVITEARGLINTNFIQAITILIVQHSVVAFQHFDPFDEPLPQKCRQCQTVSCAK